MYLARACELAARGVGNTSPNPPVGAVIVRDGATLGEGFHERRGSPHAEIEALNAARWNVRGATLYVSLEPCDHTGLTPPCTRAIVNAGIARVVIGAMDPNPRTAGRGVERLRAAGIDVMVADNPEARRLVESFAVASSTTRPFVTLKMAASADGYVAPRPGPFWLTGERARAFVRDLRIAHDAVMVGAGTVAIDNPRLTVRPPHARLTPYRRVVVCDHPPLECARRIFEPAGGYLPTIVLAAGPWVEYRQLEGLAEVVHVERGAAPVVDLEEGLVALKQRGISSVLCEGGPRLAARLLAERLVDRIEWLVAPAMLAGPQAVPALALPGAAAPWIVDRVERLDEDVRLSARPGAAA